MKVSYAWVKELIPDLQLTPTEVAETLTLHSFETVVDHEFKIDANIRVVEILKVEVHPNADRLRLATVTDGKNEMKVVCGAHNIEVGQKVPYSPPGTVVIDKHGQPFTLAVAKIRGVASRGMLNSKRELGLGDDHDGIFVLPPDTPLGTSLQAYFPSDTILECDITPNRAHDCLSHVGIARELAAILKLEVKEPEVAVLPPAEENISGRTVKVEDAAITPRYMNIMSAVAEKGTSPLWLQHRLLMAGLRPISPIVDITNYVMVETGNPSHAFATDKLPGKAMGVRFGKTGESLQLLDGTTVTLTPEMLVITSHDTPIALAGIMGGAGTHVDDSTREIVIEIANFHPYAIQKTALKHNLRTEAANRFIKAIEPQRVAMAAARLSHLLQTIIGAKVEGVIDSYADQKNPSSIAFDIPRVKKISLLDTSAQEITSILTRLRFAVEEKDAATILVTPPTDRLDVTGPHDVAEEVVRMVGLVNIPTAVVSENEPGVALPHAVMVREALRNQLVVVGFTETYNYSMEPSAMAHVVGIDPKGHLELTNPPAPELTYLRTSLMPGLLATMVKNKPEVLREGKQRERAFFEVGHTYRLGEGGKVPGVIEEEYAAGICLGDPTDTIKTMLTTLNIPADKHNEMSRAGTLSSAIAKKMKFPGHTIGFFEINLTMMASMVAKTSGAGISLADIKSSTEVPAQFVELNKYPSVFRDLSLLVDPSIPVEKIQGTIEQAGGSLVVDTELFDEYEPDDDPGSGAKKKSVAFHIEYASADRTLTDEEVNHAHETIIQEVTKELGAEVR